MKDFKQITHDSYYKMENYHQISIDLIEEAENLFNSLDEEDRYVIEQLRALSYDIGIVLEVFNPIFEIEISDLKDLDVHIDNKINELKEKIK